MRCDKHRKRDRYHRKAHRVKFANITTSPIVSKESMLNERENPSTGSSSTHLINNREQATRMKYVSSAIKYGLANGILSRTGNSFSFSDNIVDLNPYGPKQYKISKSRKQKVPSLRTCKICTQRLNLRPSLNRNPVLKQKNMMVENDSGMFENPSSEEFLKSFSTVLRRSDSSIQSNLCDKSCGRTPEKKMH